MFRLVENTDGTVTVICRETNRMICTVPCKEAKKKALPIAIGRPMPRVTVKRESDIPCIPETTQQKLKDVLPRVQVTAPCVSETASVNSNSFAVTHGGSLPCSRTAPLTCNRSLKDISTSHNGFQPIQRASPFSSSYASATYPASCDAGPTITQNPVFQPALQLPDGARLVNIVESESDDELEMPPCEPPEFPDIDYSEDCITNEEFFQTLNLIPSKKLATTELSPTLLTEFPLRHISRRSRKSCFTLPQQGGLFDIDLCSPLGKKWLSEASVVGKYHMDEERAMLSIKAYDSYCRLAVSNMYVNGCRFPKLRCREVKSYPVTFRPSKNGNMYHTYSFTERQRLKKLQLMGTGLSSRSHRLKRLCKMCTVNLSRLSEETIRKWTAKKPVMAVNSSIFFRTSSPEVITIDSDEESPYSVQPTAVIADLTEKVTSLLSPCSEVAEAHVKPEITQCTSVQHRHSIPKCFVVLEDIQRDMVYRSGGFYVRGTNIKVSRHPVYAKQPSSTTSSHQTEISMGNSKLVMSVRSHDHSYHKIHPRLLGLKSVSASVHLKSHVPNSFQRMPLGPGMQCNNVVSVLRTKDDGQVPKQSVVESLRDVKISSTNSPGMQQAENTASWKYVFHCFGCCKEQTFNSKSEADIAVQEHMIGYHAVLQPGMFLETRPDKSRNLFVIEAFPGYKSTNVY